MMTLQLDTLQLDVQAPICTKCNERKLMFLAFVQFADGQL